MCNKLMEKRCKVNTNCVGARGEGLFNVLCSTFKVQTDTKKERPYLSPASLEPAEYAEKDNNMPVSKIMRRPNFVHTLRSLWTRRIPLKRETGREEKA